MDIFLATGLITQNDLFTNGLHQNSLTLYSLFESLGYRCYCIADKTGDFIGGYRYLEPETYVQNPGTYQVGLYVEIGLTLDKEWRAFLRRRGVHVVKLHLGNILNIDVEMTCKMANIMFRHHVLGEYDEVWTSPHYAGHVGYAAALYRTPCRTVPYVWDSGWIKGYPRRIPTPWQTVDIVVAEPNISFQKHCLYPFLLVEAFASAYPDWKGNLVLQNTERFQVNRQMQRRLAASPMKDRIQLRPRMPLKTILEQNPSAVFISHQLRNEFNYLTLELLHLGYPVLHNAKAWKDFGFFWDEEDWPRSIGTLRGMLEGSATGVDEFRPENQLAAWNKILSPIRANHRHRMAA